MTKSINTSTIKLVAFDAFDTIVHYKKDPASHNMWAYSLLLQDLWLSTVDRKNRHTEAMIRDISFHTFAQNITAIYNHLTPVDIATIYEKLQNELSTITQFPDTNPTIESLLTKNYETALISNLAQPYWEALTPLLPQIDTVAYSYKIGYKKPDKAIFEHIAKQHKIALHEILMVGNHPLHDFAAPKSYGIQALLLDRNNTECTIPAEQKIQTLTELVDILPKKK